MFHTRSFSGKKGNNVISFIILFGLTILLLSGGYQYADDAEVLEFRQGDTLAEIRAKIKHNKYEFTVADNWVTMMPPEEKAQFYTRRKPPQNDERFAADSLIDMGPLADKISTKALPSKFDWRNYNGKSYIGAVRNQGGCGSCYSFGAAAAAEGTYNVAMGLYGSNCADFSESFIAWCLSTLPEYSDHFYGCEGADYDYYELQALVDHGIISETSFPYAESDPGCTHLNDSKTAFTSWHRIPCGDITAIKTAIMNYGVVDVAVNVTSAFEAYSSGIYQDSDTSCSANPCYYEETNHAVALVGWDDSQGVFYLRNSWGSSWGENGYMRIKYTSAAVACAATYMVYSGSATTKTITVTSPDGGESLKQGNSHSITWSSTGSISNVKIQYSTNNGSSWTNITTSTANDGGYTWTVPSVTSSQCKIKISEATSGSPSDTSDSTFTISKSDDSTPPPSSGSGTVTLSRDAVYFSGTTSGYCTGTQTIWVTNTNSSAAWTASDNATWLQVSPASGTGTGSINLTVTCSGLAPGSYSGTVTVKDKTSGKGDTLTVYMTQKSSSSAPIGLLATPSNGADVMSSIPVTGWVVDDIGVSKVEIYNGNTKIGDAVFVEGARPDVEAAYPTYPNSHCAGWGYMLLTNFLPNGGNGYYTIKAKATDMEGKTTELGSVRIYCDNDSAVKPFGAIDTPTQGGTASGSQYINWGWVLTPWPNYIPYNGSTIKVWVNGSYQGNPDYDNYRSDIANLFPDYINSDGAIGKFILNTTKFTNGVHNIYWTAKDNAGNGDGIGSRYFTVRNSSADLKNAGVPDIQPSPTSPISTDRLNNMQPSDSPIGLSLGYDLETPHQALYANETGAYIIHSRELERIAIKLNHHGDANTLQGCMIYGNAIKPLPIGSQLNTDTNEFTWQPGPGFNGNYTLLFITKDENGEDVKSLVRIFMEDRYTNFLFNK